jgi:16S rRNA pseudouridine516 synthase
MSSGRLRIDQLLSRFGYCSRRDARFWVKGGRVKVSGEVAGSADERVPVDDVTIDGEPVDNPRGILALLHKPAGLVCSHEASEGASVYGLFPKRWLDRNPAITTVGRLDKDTTGVLLVTDQGDWVHRWTSPKRKVEKVYEATLERPAGPELIELFASGKLLLPEEDKPCEPAQLELPGGCEVRLTLTEGRYHQVKRMFAGQGLRVLRLHRARFGDFTLGDLAPGQWRLLDLALGPK